MNLFAELKRRNVFKVAVAYVALTWALVQLTDIVVPALNLPPMLTSIVVYLGIIGFFFAVFFAWAFELTPDGIKPTKEVDEAQNIRAVTGQKLNRLIIVLMGVVIAALLIDRFVVTDNSARSTDAASVSMANTVAVMPFADMSPDRSQEYFGDGMAEEILNVLATIDDLDVTSRTTAFSLKGQNLSIPQIAERLNVNYVVEGSIRSDGDFVRVTAQLIDVANDNHLWSETFDRELKGIFAIQDEISLAIADALKVELLGDQVGDVPTNNMEAYDLYLRALREFDVPTWEGVKEAQAMLSRAVELDPGFAEGWAYLGSSYGAEIIWGDLNHDEIDRNLDLSIDAVNRALLQNPNLVIALLSISNAYVQKMDWDKAWLYIERASQLQTSDQRYLLDFGLFYTAVGWFDDAIRALERSVASTPEHSVAYSVLGRAYFSNGEIQKAVAALETSIDMGYPAAAVNMVMVHLAQGDVDAAKAAIGTGGPHGKLQAHARSVGLEAEDYRLKMIDGFFDPSLREGYSKLLPENEEFQMLITGSMMLKNSEHLTNWLDDSTYNRFLIITYLYAPPFRDMLNQPAMKEYINSIGLPDFWRRNKWPHFCRPVGDDDYECQDMEGNYP
jgi:TolB-like protein/tetratricopeptide (TPR) repeat protein